MRSAACYTIFWRYTTVLHLLPATASCTNLVQKKPIFWAKPAHFDFFTVNFIVWSHKLSTSGDAVRGQDGIAGTTYMLGTTNPKLKTHAGQVSKPSKNQWFLWKNPQRISKVFWETCLYTKISYLKILRIRR